MQDLKITLIQTNLVWENIEKNVQYFQTKIEALNKETDLIILPEMFSTGFSMNAEQLAEPMDGPTIRWMRRISKKYNFDITGSLIISDNDRFYNRLIWVKPDGSLMYYDKRHLFRMGQEQEIYSAGDTKITIELNGWKIRPLICYDLRFPVWARNTDKDMYDLLIYVANWPDKRTHHWKSLLTARAIENQAYTAGLNRIGSDGNKVSYCGDSLIVEPFGKTLALLENKEIIHTETLSKNSLIKYRERFPAWKDGDKFKII